MKLSAAKLRQRLERVKLVLTDVDGVLTSGQIYHFVDAREELVEFKGMNAKDSIAMAWLGESGLTTGVISGRMSKGTHERLKILKVKHIHQHRLDKANVLADILASEGATAEQTAYMGDDLPDLPVLRRVGVAVAPADARPEVRAAAHRVTRAKAGEGAFREFTEELLKAQGLWESILRRYN